MTTPLDVVAADADSEVAEALIRFLNELVQMDPEAMHRLVEARVSCNEALADHPTVQVRKVPNGFEVGILGLLNGFVGADLDGWGFVCAEFDDDEKLVRFKRTPPRIQAQP